LAKAGVADRESDPGSSGHCEAKLIGITGGVEAALYQLSASNKGAVCWTSRCRWHVGPRRRSEGSRDKADDGDRASLESHSSHVKHRWSPSFTRLSAATLSAFCGQGAVLNNYPIGSFSSQ
jgi:hypothetical protein